MWGHEQIQKALREHAANILSVGPIPKHVAFCMDGNRRFARQRGLEMGAGHFAGFRTFLELVVACQMLGISTVTAYAFSIENFNRPQHESRLLFNMVRTQLWDLAHGHESQAQQSGWRVRFLGNRSLLDPDIIDRINAIEAETALGNKLTINICCPYTSRDDMAHAMMQLAGTPNLYEHGLPDALYTSHSEPLDLLVRTSGETRLSDFMCWEVTAQQPQCDIVFLPTLWPSFRVWQFYCIILEWGLRRTIQPEPAGQLMGLKPAPPLVSVTEHKVAKTKTNEKAASPKNATPSNI